MWAKCIIILIIPFIQATPLQEQPHLKHQWQHRVLLVISNETNKKSVENQIEELTSNLTALNERKLIVYQIKPDLFKQGLAKQSPWISNTKWYDVYADETKSLEIVLFGLDGGKKLDCEQVLTAEKLFANIDAMPMRQSELRQKH